MTAMLSERSKTDASPATDVAPPSHALLRGPKVHLRPTESRDFDEAYRRALEIGDRGPWFPHNIRSEAAFKAAFADGRWGEESGVLRVIQNSDDALVGQVMFERVVGDVDEVILGYLMYPEYRGQGLGTEANRLFVEYLFANRRDMNRATLYIHPDNAASIRLAERTGFSFESRIREGWFDLGRWNDVLCYSLLRRELVDGKVAPR